tara:strand:- start:988 stop:1617 length:630 start_codon:yes stop_codon:yes gene_type:complete
MDLSMNSSDFDNIFFFKANSIKDINNETTLFYVNENNWPDISFSEGIVSNNGKQDIGDYASIYTNVKTFGPAWMANNITSGGSKSSNIFSNENELIQQYIALDSNENHNGIKQKIIQKLKEAGTELEPLTNSNKNSKNITQDIISHFMHSNPNITERLVNMYFNENTWNPIKFVKGDVIQFDIIYDVNRFCIHRTNVDDQDYLVRITLY